MALIIKDRVRDTTTTTGTGPVTVSGTAPTAYRTFSAVCSTSDTFYYSIAHQGAAEWESGIGTYSGTNEITRTTVLESSNGDSAVDFSAGTKDVFFTFPGAKIIETVHRTRVARTSNTELGVGDRGKLIDITSGTFSQTFAAAATLGSGWWLYLRNSGTGNVTLDPNSTEQIDGLTSFIMYPGESRLITCDGTGFYSSTLAPGVAKFTSSGTFVVPPGVSRLLVRAVGAGGGGGSGRRGSSGTARLGGGGGGGGACVEQTLYGVTPGSSVTVTIGAGGTAGAAVSSNDTDGADGGVGGTTTFGSYVSAYGGGGGYKGNAGGVAGGSGGGGAGAGAVSAAGSAVAGGLPNLIGGKTAVYNNQGYGGGTGGTQNNATNFPAAEWGGGGGNGAFGTTSYNGGSSMFGGGGGGGGGNVSSGNAGNAGGNGGTGGLQAYAIGDGVTGGDTTPSAGTAGAANATGYGGGGGSGGGAHASSAGGAGGAGGAPGGGGGGGAASLNGASSGAGGAGGRGEVSIFWS